MVTRLDTCKYVRLGRLKYKIGVLEYVLTDRNKFDINITGSRRTGNVSILHISVLFVVS